MSDVTNRRGHDRRALRSLYDRMCALRDDVIRLEHEAAPLLDRVHPARRASAVNLIHYIAMREHDVRPLQSRLASIGLSSLGRAESCVLATIDAVLYALECMADRAVKAPPGRTAFGVSTEDGVAMLESNSRELLGAEPAHRRARIMAPAWAWSP